MPTFVTDLRYAARTLLKSPGFAAAAIGALALGIGANTAIFSVVNEVLLNPAGIANPDRIAALRVKYDKLALKSIGVSVPDFSDVQKSTQLFESGALLVPISSDLCRIWQDSQRTAGESSGIT